MKILSLFSGIGAFEKALTKIGVNYNLIGFSEVDKYAIKSYCTIHNIREEKNLGDVTRIVSDDIEDFEMLIGGSPCQNISIASKIHNENKEPLGLKGKESRLFFEYARILNEKKPKYFVFENVRNLLSSNNGEDFKIVKELLGEF